jgi:hypothetical protein
MRPNRLQTLLLDAARKASSAAHPLPQDEGDKSRPPFGVAMTAGSGQVWWSFTVAGAPGDKYSEPEPEPTPGPRPAAITMPQLSPKAAVTDLEQALASALLQLDEHAEIAAIDRHSQQDIPGAIPYGLTVRFHSGAIAYINGLATLDAGQESPRQHRYYQLADAV